MLLEYDDLDSSFKNNLLLGNGFSIGVSSDFTYGSLIDVAIANGFLSDTDKKLFKKFDTVNFETILYHLFITKQVNKILSIQSKTPAEKYEYVKDALIKSVNKVHPLFDEINSFWLDNVVSELLEYDNIFSTNYDLLLYWLMSKNDFNNFTDYFWSGNLSFDQFNTEIWNGKIPVHYLHGALFIYISDDLEVKKTKKTEHNSLLENVERLINSNKIPLFISEGSSNKKLNAIQNNSYLNFVFKEFHSIRGGLTIYGSSMEDSDDHIVEAINKNNSIEKIAISIYTNNKSDDEIENEMKKYRLKLWEFGTQPNKKIDFFDFSTSPFAYH